MSTFDADQPPLGINFGNDGEASHARVIAMAPGDLFVLVTDGFFECTNRAGEMRGTVSLGESIRRHRMFPANSFVRNLHEEVRDFAQGAPQADDLTVVVIKRLDRAAASPPPVTSATSKSEVP